MSYLSLPRVLSNFNSRNSSDKKSKTLSLNRSASDAGHMKKVYSTLSLNETSNRRNRILNKNGNISSQHFRGVHRHLLDIHAKTVCQSMTVSKNTYILNRNKGTPENYISTTIYCFSF